MIKHSTAMHELTGTLRAYCMRDFDTMVRTDGNICEREEAAAKLADRVEDEMQEAACDVLSKIDIVDACEEWICGE